MIYELRTYTANPGKMEALNARFRDHTRTLFARHGMQSVGYWIDQESGDLVYLITHESREAAVANWTGFRSDPEWIKVKNDSEVDGVLVAGIKVQFLTPTDYSMLR